MNLRVLILLCSGYLTACAVAPTGHSAARLPALDPIPKAVLEQSFIDRMESFLSGKLPEQINSESP